MRSLPATLTRLGASLLCLVGCVGCSDDGPHRQAAVTPSSTSEPMGDCSAILRYFEGGSAEHHPECSAIDYAMSPPVFGDHYPVWAAYRTYDFAVPLGYLVHDLEHGAVVFFYDCPDGCSDEVADARTLIDSLPDDPRCPPDARVQVILTPRPGLGARWAAAAWGYSLSADCFDARLFAEFYADHHGQGRENLCNQGVVLESGACR